MKWLESTLGVLVEVDGGVIQTGPFGSQLHEHEYESEGVPVIMPRDISDGRVLTDSVARVSEQTASRLSRHKVRRGDIILPRRGEIAKRAFVRSEQEGWLCGTGCLKITLTGSVCLTPEFLYYYMEQGSIVQWLEQHAVGTTMLNLNTQIVGRLPVRYPAIEAQRTIASVLSSYDDLIENNRRRMTLLEESARLLYREWFIRLRFPGYEHTEILDGVPDGWEIQALDNICTVGRGASPRPIAEFLDGEISWFKIGDGTASASLFILETEEKVTEDGAKRSVFLEPHSLILSNSATCGIPFITGVRGCVHDGWLHFSEYRRVSVWFLYCYFCFHREVLVNSVGDGSTQKNLNTSAVSRMKITLPINNLLLGEFDEFVQPLFLSILTIAKQNVALRTARNLLLPRLMGGQFLV